MCMPMGVAVFPQNFIYKNKPQLDLAPWSVFWDPELFHLLPILPKEKQRLRKIRAPLKVIQLRHKSVCSPGSLTWESKLQRTHSTSYKHGCTCTWKPRIQLFGFHSPHLPQRSHWWRITGLGQGLTADIWGWSLSGKPSWELWGGGAAPLALQPLDARGTPVVTTTNVPISRYPLWGCLYKIIGLEKVRLNK